VPRDVARVVPSVTTVELRAQVRQVQVIWCINLIKRTSAWHPPARFGNGRNRCQLGEVAPDARPCSGPCPWSRWPQAASYSWCQSTLSALISLLSPLSDISRSNFADRSILSRIRVISRLTTWNSSFSRGERIHQQGSSRNVQTVFRRTWIMPWMQDSYEWNRNPSRTAIVWRFSLLFSLALSFSLSLNRRFTSHDEKSVI